jgi:hypothetical protein
VVQPVEVTDVPAVHEYIRESSDVAILVQQAMGEGRPQLLQPAQQIANAGTIREGHIDLQLTGQLSQ